MTRMRAANRVTPTLIKKRSINAVTEPSHDGWQCQYLWAHPGAMWLGSVAVDLDEFWGVQQCFVNLAMVQ